MAAVIVHFGNAALTAKAAASIAKVPGPIKAVYVVENGSEAGIASEGMVRPPLRQENLGYAAGVNRGVRAAIHEGFDRVVVMNNDLVLAAGAADAMAGKMDADESIGICGAPVLEENGKTATGEGRINWFTGRAEMIVHPRKAGRADYINGALFAISKECFEAIGGLNEDYFHTWEDVELSFSARARGYGIAAADCAPSAHAASSSLPDSPLKTYYLVRNGVLFMRKWLPLPWRIFYGPLLDIRTMLAVARGKEPVVRGIIDGRAGKKGKVEYA